MNKKNMPNTQLRFSLSTQLDHFDLAVEAEFNQLVTGIFGVSGAGKSTIFECLAGLKKEVHGVICFNGVYWLDSSKNIFLAPEHRGIGYVPQNGLLFPNKNVRENMLIASHRRRNRSQQHAYRKPVPLDSVCELLELDGLLERSVMGLSGGERQRVALGRAICSDPDLLLLDEPLAALDLKLKHQILPFLYRIREELNIPMVMISHSPSEIQALCDEVLVIQQGKNIAFGTARKILLNKNVLELTQGEHYENIVPAIVLSEQRKEDSSLLKIAVDNSVNHDDITLITAPVQVNPGTKLMVGIPANDIIIAIYRLEGISAQNIIPAKVTAIEHINGKYMVCTLVNDSALELNAEISAQSLGRLGFKIGDLVYLVIKSSACIIYH